MPNGPGDKHQPIREFRDAVHGFVKLTDAEVEIVNTPAFQRLRDIRQLAMGHMVYPGANHTRFEHSLGCAHVSTQILELLNERQVQVRRTRLQDAFSVDDHGIERGKKILRLASLLHDVGHPPFSHSGEKLLLKGSDHESMTARIIRESEIAEVIGRNYGNMGISVEDVIVVGTKPALCRDSSRINAWNLFLNQILTGELGADRIDYLLRDGHHSGQRSGQFDHLKLINAMTLVPPPEGEGNTFQLGLDEGGWLVAEQMVVARYLMYIALYFHKTKCIYEKHLEDFMSKWLRGGKLPKDLKRYLALSDSDVLSGIQQSAADVRRKGNGDARRFVDRTHLRLAKEVVLADNFEVDEQGRRLPDLKRFDKLAKHVRMVFGKSLIALVDSRSHHATKMFLRDSRILVLLDGKTRTLDELSEVVRGMSSKIWRGRIYCEKNHEDDVKVACEKWLEANPSRQERKNGKTRKRRALGSRHRGRSAKPRGA